MACIVFVLLFFVLQLANGLANMGGIIVNSEPAVSEWSGKTRS